MPQGKPRVKNSTLNQETKRKVSLLSDKISVEQYFGSAIPKFRLRFNQFKSKLKLYREVRTNFKEIRFLEHFDIDNQQFAY